MFITGTILSTWGWEKRLRALRVWLGIWNFRVDSFFGQSYYWWVSNLFYAPIGRNFSKYLRSAQIDPNILDIIEIKCPHRMSLLRVITHFKKRHPVLLKLKRIWSLVMNCKDTFNLFNNSISGCCEEHYLCISLWLFWLWFFWY